MSFLEWFDFIYKISKIEPSPEVTEDESPPPAYKFECSIHNSEDKPIEDTAINTLPGVQGTNGSFFS